MWILFLFAFSINLSGLLPIIVKEKNAQMRTWFLQNDLPCSDRLKRELVLFLTTKETSTKLLALSQPPALYLHQPRLGEKLLPVSEIIETYMRSNTHIKLSQDRRQ